MLEAVVVVPGAVAHADKQTSMEKALIVVARMNA